MSTTAIVLATVASLTRRVSQPKNGNPGKPYFLALVDLTLEGQPCRTPVVIGCSPAQLAKGVTESELGALGLDLETAITAPEKAIGAEVSLRFEQTDANPDGSWRIVTAQNVPEADFRAALAAQRPAAPAPKPTFRK